MHIASQPPQQRLKLRVEGDRPGGGYQQLQGEGVDLRLEHRPSYVDIGGVLVEQEGSYRASGHFRELTTDLRIVPQDQVIEVEGVPVQIDTSYQVQGQIGAQAIQGQIHEEEQVVNVGGILVETDSWKVFEGPGVHFEVRQQGDGHRVSGQSQGQPLDLQVLGLDGGREMILQGQAPNETLAEIASLRPFLAP